ncbi:GreA/GreB family elongation factor [Streptomyces sp. SID5910]|uniref:GreA/GreB family elongation factor n=1 Tax=Streptomyces sp. SID5910 TaxID=2690312 RepID=UPI0013699DA5|nr:GreA/GreB family elongation factor [Streptomyces sp. SID5910]MYR43824.1 nucleoside diphosphate kinase regulator [Streptomyces sp. SID5910]
MPSEPAPISDDARHALEQERADLRTERGRVAATLRGSDDEVGDRADAADELQRADTLRKLDARIADITTRLTRAADAGPPPTDAVGVGSSVTVRYGDGSEETFEIGERAVASDRALVTADSPLGHALLGRRPGDTVTYDTPEGRTTVTVVSLGGAADGRQGGTP